MSVIERVVEDWHRYLKGELDGGLDALLAEDIVFYSPVVFTPQEGREIAKLYLGAAGNTLGGDDEPGSNGNAGAGKFRYTKKVIGENQAVLEFETTMDGKYVNGVDILTCNDAGQITEFRVMLRPLQAVNKVHEKMAAMLAKMKA